MGSPSLSPIAPPRAVSGLLLLADIGGYTAFLGSVTNAHRDDAFADGSVPDAYALVSSLLDGIVGRTVPPFTLSKLDGDAVFVYAVDGDAIPRGDGFLACLQDCYADFQNRLASAGEIWSCRCDACARISTLDLKFIVHAGPFIIQSIAGREEVVRSEVVLAHRLLKSGAADVVGRPAYALITEPAARLVDLPTKGAVPLVEHVDHYEPVEEHVFGF